LILTPNPVVNETQISFNRTIAKGELFFYDITGRMLEHDYFENKNSISKECRLPCKGLYFCKIVDLTTGSVETTKMIYSP